MYIEYTLNTIVQRVRGVKVDVFIAMHRRIYARDYHL